MKKEQLVLPYPRAALPFMAILCSVQFVHNMHILQIQDFPVSVLPTTFTDLL